MVIEKPQEVLSQFLFSKIIFFWLKCGKHISSSNHHVSPFATNMLHLLNYYNILSPNYINCKYHKPHGYTHLIWVVLFSKYLQDKHLWHQRPPQEPNKLNIKLQRNRTKFYTPQLTIQNLN